MSDGIYKRLVDAFQDQDDEREKKEREAFLKSDQCVVDPSLRFDSWKIIVGEHLPPRTLYVSQDVFDALKKASDIGRVKP